jgi:predicted DNA-binding transcriptional regulator AlpA
LVANERRRQCNEAGEAPAGHDLLAESLDDVVGDLAGRVALPVPRLALRLEEVAAALGVGLRTVVRLRSAGRFPKPDKKIGKCPVWAPATIAAWLKEGDA